MKRIVTMATAAIAALRAASSPTAREKALSQALDRLVSSSSIPETQTLLDAVFESFRRQDQDDINTFVNSVASAVAVCTAPPRKAELLGHLLLDHLLQWVLSTDSHPDAVRTSREALLRIAQANPATVDGVLTAIDYQEVISPALPLLVAVLVNSKPQSTQKLAVIHTLVRIAWTDEDAKANVASLLVSVCPLCPLSADPDAWRVYAALVSSTVDLLVEATNHHKHAETVANSVLRRVLYGLEQELSVIPLLQALVSLSEALGEVLHTSQILFLLGSVLQHAASSAKDQSLILRILEALLPSTPSTSSSRSVYVESLVVPLVSVLSTHSPQASTLLQTVLDTAATVPFAVPTSVRPDPEQGHHAAHASAFLSVMASLQTAEAWLDSLFHKQTPEIQTHSATLLQQLGACLVDRRGRLRSLALDVLTRQLQLKRVDRSVDDWPPAQVKLLVSTLVVLSSHKRNSSGEWLSQCFQVLVSVAATTTDTMKVVLRLVKKLASTTGLKPQAIHLLRLVWTQDSRVYPQLEAMLQPEEEEEETEDEDEEMEIVRMATILAVCEKDPETGVEWIGEIQGFLESDRVGVVAMAVRAVRLLCVADCLELETTIKFLSVKIKKQRIQCVDDPLFLSELCALYASCGSGGVESSSPKYAARVVDELWTLTESDEVSVRRDAFQAMASFSLVALGLRLLDDLEKSRQGQDADEEEDEDDEDDERTPEEVEENVDRVWGCLQAEEDNDVRCEIEALAKRILDAECAKLPSARGGDARVSAAATKEMKKLLPSRQQVVDASVDGPALLLAFECADVVESTAAPKRKDKRLRVVAAQVEEMKAILKRCLDGSSSSCGLLDQLRAVEAWLSFGGKLVDRLVELATLRTPNDAAAGHTAGLMKEMLTELVAELVDGGQPQRWLAIAAVTHHACGLALATSSSAVADAIEKTRGELRAQWRSAMEALRVFQDDDKRSELVQWLLLALAVATPSTRDEETDADASKVLSWLSSGACRGDGLQAASLLFVSHISSLPRVGEDRTMRRQHVKTTVDAVVGWLLRSSGSAARTVSVCVDTPLVVDAVMLSQQSNPTVQWAAAMGLAQLARTLADVGRLQWLDNLRTLLHKMWDASSAVGVALGQVLLESVYFNRVDGAQVQHFVDAALASSSPLSVVAAAFVLRRMPSLGCVVAAADLERFLEVVSAQKQDPLASVAAGNLLHASTGVLFVPSPPLKEVEVALDTSVVLRFVSVMDSVAQAALADRRDAVVVLQRTTTLDAQVPTLPPSTLLSKSLEAARVGRDDGLNAAASASVLRCVAHASRSHPLPLELSVLALRVLSRFAMDLSVLTAAIELAGAHASCTALLSENLLSSTRLANYSPTVVAACVDGLASASKRLPVALLTTLLTRLFDALVEIQERGEEEDGDSVHAAFHEWVEFTGVLVDTPPPKEGSLAATGESEHDGVAKAVGAQVLAHVLPCLPHSTRANVASSRALLRSFAAQVLAKVPQSREAVVDAVVASSQTDAHAWWRASVMLAELLRSGYISSSSVVLRWLQQTESVDEGVVVDGVVADVVEAVVASAAAKKKAPLEVNEPWILELLDVAGKADCGRGKRVMLWSIVDALVAWGELRTHEAFVLAGDVSRVAARRESIAGSLPALVVEALARRLRDRLVASEAIVKQLWIKSDQRDVGGVLRRELHVAASNALLSQDSESEVVRELSLL